MKRSVCFFLRRREEYGLALFVSSQHPQPIPNCFFRQFSRELMRCVQPTTTTTTITKTTTTTTTNKAV